MLYSHMEEWLCLEINCKSNHNPTAIYTVNIKTPDLKVEKFLDLLSSQIAIMLGNYV